MRRFLMFLVIAIAVVSLGLTIYYFSTDNEVISIKSSYLVVNKGDYIKEDSLLDFKNKNKHTTLSYGLQQEDHEDNKQNVLSHSGEGWFLAMSGGESKIVITTNNMNYSKLVVDVLVCDGSEEYPYIVKTEEELRKIGKEDPIADDSIDASQYSYKLGNDIKLKEKWTPISTYKGVFDGNYFTISDMKIDSSFEGINAGFVLTLKNTGVIKNLFLTNVDIQTDKNYVGAFAGTNYGLIQTCEAEGTIISESSGVVAYLGSIAGRNIDETAKIDRCGFVGTIRSTGTSLTAGGITGHNHGGHVSETYFRGVVENNEANFGGIVGKNESKENAPANIYDSYFYLTKEETGTVRTKIFGITYENIKNAEKNMITGCYYGGSAETNLSLVVKSNGEIESQANGFLTTEHFYKKGSFVTTIEANGKNKSWNFSSVWEITNSSKYPILNVYSTVGSTYVIDVSDIITGKDITTAEQLYALLSGTPDQQTYKISRDIDMSSFVWGSEEHPIPESFDKELINGTTIDAKTGKERPCEITGLTIENKVKNGDVGLVKTLGSGAVIKGLVIKEVNIQGEKAKNVGVLAGISNGAHIKDVRVSDVTVSIEGFAFGGIFGMAKSYEGHGIIDVVVEYVKLSQSYFDYAGGVAGINLSVIDSSENDVYNNIYCINLMAHFAGGIAGANGGKIAHSVASDITFSAKQNEKTIETVYNGSKHVFVGGIVGQNHYNNNSQLKKGSIENVYAQTVIEAETGNDYLLLLGGVAGNNSGSISKAYVKDSEITVTGSQTVQIGGIAGYNEGKIISSVVNKGTQITANTQAGTSEVKDGGYLLLIENHSVVGGIVGINYNMTDSNASIYGCATFAKKIQGDYAGGIAGVSYSGIEKSFCGDSAVTNGGVSITGFFVGGMSAVVSGQIKDCYVFAQLNTVFHGKQYKGIQSVIKMDVSAAGGIAVFVLDKQALVKGCYVVTTFSGEGYSYSLSANLNDFTANNCGKIENCIYQNRAAENYHGEYVSSERLRGEDSHNKVKGIFKDNLSIWNFITGEYPTLADISVRFPSDRF